MTRSDGFPIVLTADRTLMAGYHLLFDGMLAASQTTLGAPPLLVGRLLMPAPANGGSPAPLGLRRIESALLRDGFPRAQVAVVDERHLSDAIGPATRIVGISSGEPLGLGMNTSTMTAVAGGRIYPQAMFERLLKKVRVLLAKRAPSAQIVAGGPGAWQLAQRPQRLSELGMRHVICGYAEQNVAATFRSMLAGEALPPVCSGQWSADSIPPISGPTTMGVVEISRGCGLNCGFCTIARVPMVHLPAETIVADVSLNVAHGQTSIAALSEDLFRYGADGMRCQPEALMSLLRRLRAIEGLKLIQVDHANICSIAQYDDAQLTQVHDLLVGGNQHHYLWLNVGVETACGELLRDIGGAGKMNRCPPEEWGALCAQQVRRLCAAGFFPMVSLMLGLPGETEQHIRQTLRWVRDLSDQRISVFPMLHAPIDGGEPLTIRSLKPWHWELIRACYRLNFKWVPRMYWDNQRGAGVPLTRRVILQGLGLGQVLQWKTLFAFHAWRARA